MTMNIDIIIVPSTSHCTRKKLQHFSLKITMISAPTIPGGVRVRPVRMIMTMNMNIIIVPSTSHCTRKKLYHFSLKIYMVPAPTIPSGVRVRHK